MKRSIGRVRQLLPMAVVCAMAACGGSPPRDGGPGQQPEPAGTMFIGRTPVYAHLVASRGEGWIFTSITDSDAPPKKGFLVRFNDLTPGFDMRVAECMPQVYPDTHRCNLGNPFREKHAGVLDKIINSGISMGTAGKVSDVSASYETSFDEAAFNQAVDEALVNTGLESARRKIIANYERYESLLAQNRDRFSELEREAALAMLSAQDEFSLDIQPTLTGLTVYYGSDIDYHSLLELTPRPPARPDKVNLGRVPALPCDAATCLENTVKAISRLQRDIEKYEAGFASIISPTSVTYDIECDSTTAGEYTVRIDCPDEIEASRTKTTELPIRVHIFSRDFSPLIPFMQIGDERLAISIDGERVTFANPTSAYESVTAQTLYYNSHFETNTSTIELAPGASMVVDIGEFLSPPIEIESSYLRMTPDKAAGASFRFGFAVRYHVAGDSEERTLYEMQTYNVGCVIDNRLRPGSCVSGHDDGGPAEPDFGIVGADEGSGD